MPHLQFLKKTIIGFLTLSSVPTSFCADTCPPSLSETRENAGQSWWKGKMLYLQQVSTMFQNAVSATKTPLISCHNELNKFRKEMMYGKWFSPEYLVRIPVFISHQQLKKTKKDKMPSLGLRLSHSIKNMDKKPELPELIRLEDSTLHETLNAYLDISFLIIFVPLFKILKQMNHYQRRKSVFCFSWKVGELQIWHFALWPTKHLWQYY